MGYDYFNRNDPTAKMEEKEDAGEAYIYVKTDLDAPRDKKLVSTKESVAKVCMIIIIITFLLHKLFASHYIAIYISVIKVVRQNSL